jgi:hypothetical protein
MNLINTSIPTCNVILLAEDSLMHVSFELWRSTIKSDSLKKLGRYY